MNNPNTNLINKLFGFFWLESNLNLTLKYKIQRLSIGCGWILEDVRIILSGLWIALMLTYLLGDVLRIFAADFKAGEMEGRKMTQAMLLGMSVLMLIPIVMLFLSLVLAFPLIQWVNIVVAIFLIGFNLIGLPTYPGAYDKFLIIVGLVFNALIIFYAWNWI
jgi:hypothetical protein